MSRFLGLLAALVFLGGVSSNPQQSVPTAVQAIPTYPNSASGLEAMMNDMLALAKRGDTTALVPYFQSLVLPHAEDWFKSEFGDENCGTEHMAANDCLGSRLALAYASRARTLSTAAARALSVLIDENLTDFEAVNYSQPCAGPQRIVPARQLVGDLTTTPILSPVLSGLIQHHEPVYVLWSYNEKAETTVAFFVYSDGAFRYIGMPHPASLDEFARRAEIPQGGDLANEIVDAQPVLADQALLQRTVVLHVIIGPDGKAREVSYVRGPERFSNSAIETIKKRHFPQQSLGGHAIQVDTCINVVSRH
jgi:hypothetical protein